MSSRLPQRLTTIEYRIGWPMLEVIDRHMAGDELVAHIYVLEGFEDHWTDRRLLYSTRNPLHIEAFGQLRDQATGLEFVSRDVYRTTNPGMNWVIAESSVGYGLPAKQDFVGMLRLGADLLERGYGMEEEPFSELGLLLFNREMSSVQWHPAFYHYLATELFDAWVRSNGVDSAPVNEVPGRD